jgi:hypothetical protein
MKKALLSVLLIAGFLLIAPYSLLGQFPRIYGTSGNDGIIKVIPAGSEYYVLGYTGANPNSTWKATISRLNASGSVIWTKSLDIFSQWNDGIVTPNGDLLVIGTTLPYSTTSQSIMGLISSSGIFSWVRSSNVSGREILNRIALNPVPQNSSFPYYVLGQYYPGSGSDIILMTLDANGNTGWKKRFPGSNTYNFSNDLEVLPNGDLLMTGGVIFRADNTGQIYNAAAIEGQFRFGDVSQRTGGGFYAIGSEGGNFSSQLIKFDNDFIPLWQIAIPNLQGTSQVWSVGNDIYLTASRSIGPMIQGVLLKFRDNGTSPAYLWTKYLKLNEPTPFGFSSVGFTTFLPPNKIAYADARRRTNGYGFDDGFISVSDLDFNTCMTQLVTDNFQVKDNLFFSPLPLTIEFVDVLPSTAVTSSSLTWSDFDACLTDCTCAFSSMQILGPLAHQVQTVTCGGVPVTLSCLAGTGYIFTGSWGPGTPININWTLSGPGATQNGTCTGNNPFFSINLLPTYFSQPGLYTLTLQGKCGDKICPCIVQFNVNCPDPCPCSSSDLQTFQANVAKGFATTFASSSCKVCFSPVALTSCETVEWFLNSGTGTPIGISTGNQSFCHSFSGPGTYNVKMIVTRKKSDGSLCEIFSKTQTLAVTCGPMAPVGDPLIKNSSFSQNPVAGGLNSGGSASGWAGIAGNPILMGGVTGSQDGWAMYISGNASASDLLSSTETVCISKTENGSISLHLRIPGDPIPGADVKVGRKPPPFPGRLSVQLSSGQGSGCSGGNCFTVATLADWESTENDEWYEIRIPYNLSSWEASESCGKGAGTIPVKVLISVSNPFFDNQGDGINHDAVLIDYISFNSITTGIELPAFQEGALRLYPNPASAYFTIELAQEPAPGTVIRIIKSSGQVISERQAQAGECIQTFDSGSMPAGLYFVQVMTEGRLIGVEKLIKQ